VAINYVFVLPRNVGSTSAFSSLGQVRLQQVCGLVLSGSAEAAAAAAAHCLHVGS
jgi:hypothetical protein